MTNPADGGLHCPLTTLPVFDHCIDNHPTARVDRLFLAALPACPKLTTRRYIRMTADHWYINSAMQTTTLLRNTDYFPLISTLPYQCLPFAGHYTDTGGDIIISRGVFDHYSGRGCD